MMTMKNRLTRISISALVAAALMGGLLFAIRIPSRGPTIFSMLCLPFYMIGVLFSHSVHAPDEIATNTSMFLFFFVVAYAVFSLWSKRAGTQ